MTESVQRVLTSFDALSDSERREAAVEILRRGLRDALKELPDEALVAAADELFVELDEGEAEDGQS